MSVSINEVLSINLDMLHTLLDTARTSALQASAAMAAGNRNLAIGNVLDLEGLLPECEALYRTIILLHRSRVGEGLP